MKILAASLIFVIAIIVGRIPLYFERSNKLKSSLEYCNALTIGLFLSVGLMHLLPSAIEHFQQHNPKGSSTSVFVVCTATAIALQIIEKIGNKIVNSTNTQTHWLSYFLMIVLSVHSILEGLVLGFELNPKYEMTIFLAIIAHKGAESFSLITNMLTSKIQRHKIIISLVFFSMTTPIGVVLGKNMIDINIIGPDTYLLAYFESIAAGTFVYIAMKNIPYTYKNSTNTLLAILGFVGMSFLTSFI